MPLPIGLGGDCRRMAASTFHTNPFDLNKLLEDCQNGVLQLPDFQRSWVWDEDRIKSLIASVSRAFPVGALMSLDTGGPVNFRPRPVEGAPDSAKQTTPRSLLLDGQQRMTSLYQVTLRGKVVPTPASLLVFQIRTFCRQFLYFIRGTAVARRSKPESRARNCRL